MDPNLAAKLAATSPEGITATTVTEGTVPPIETPDDSAENAEAGSAAGEGSPEGAAGDPPPPAEQPEKSRKTVLLTTQQLNDLRKAERTRAEAAKAKELDKQARALGHKDWASFLAAQQAHSKKPNAATQDAEETEDDAEDEEEVGATALKSRSRMTARDKEVAKLVQERQDAHRQLSRETKKSKRLAAQLAAQEAENELRILAVRHGVVDIDYAITLIRRRTSSMTHQQIVAFDENKFFAEELRKSHPYLYNERVETVHTDPTSAEAPPPPAAGARSEGSGNGGAKKDARDMTPEEYEKHLQQLGLSNPGRGISIPS